MPSTVRAIPNAQAVAWYGGIWIPPYLTLNTRQAHDLNTWRVWYSDSACNFEGHGPPKMKYCKSKYIRIKLKQKSYQSKWLTLVVFFLVSALLRDCSLCWDRCNGTWHLHLTRPYYVALGGFWSGSFVGLVWGALSIGFRNQSSLQYNILRSFCIVFVLWNLNRAFYSLHMYILQFQRT